MQTPRISVLVSPHRLERGQLAGYAQRAEAAGLPALWVTESSADALIFALEMLAATDRLITGSCIAPRWKRHPQQMAEAAATIDHLYPGRFAIGLGSAGWIEDPRHSFGQGLDRPVARMREYVEVLRAALCGEEFDHAGEFYDAVGQLPFGPGRRVPIYVAAGGPKFSRMSGRVADGIFIQADPPETLRGLSDAMGAAAVEADRKTDELRIHQMIVTSVAETLAEARDKLRRYLLEMVFIEQPHVDSLAKAGYSDVATNVSGLLKSRDETAAMDAIPDEVVDLLTLPLTPQVTLAEVASQLAAKAAGAGATDVILACHASEEVPDTDRGAADWVDEYDGLFAVIPSLVEGSSDA
jgi:alkanesulfonate monooxygenase SsuD/methylene tetrahydromethanopterin reductase-like flavin-dependent oxidoreductase (luciferase family)